MFESLVPRASSFAGDIDDQIWLIAILAGFWFCVATGVFFWSLFRYRHRPGERSQYITGEKPEEKRWISIPHGLVLICDVFILVGAIRVSCSQCGRNQPRASAGASTAAARSAARAVT